MKKPISLEDALHYEIHSSRFASWISWSWLQELSGRYFAWKVKRKHSRYMTSKMREFKLKNQLQ